ncbi:galactose-specific lectin nattectin-like [Cheilinus undulatus]|uniref:galactose-specific lectin nattectin-like n=1 Tax=Cheilinus undulatus TaxID=241271 RepID=UPI001BD3031A|nr:galactose-specific lectin nattectin-like [Cheilinus undulatus]
MAMTLQLILLLGLSSGLWMGANAKCHKKGGCCEGCPDGWTPIKERCYMYHNLAKEWCEAEKHCVSKGGNLISILGPNDKMAVKDILKRAVGKPIAVWTGTHDAVKNGCWLNSDGSEHHKSWAAKGKKGENCIMYGLSGNPVASDCSAKKPFICSTEVGPKD